MQKLFSTEDIDAHRKFQAWADVTYARFVPTEREKPPNPIFNASLEGFDCQNSFITKLSYDKHKLRTTASTIRRHGKQDFLTVNMVLAGSVNCGQYGRTTQQTRGDLTVFDNNAPLSLEYPDAGSTLLVELPRERLERVLGSATIFATLNIDSSVPSNSLTISFFRELMYIQENLDFATTDRLFNIGVDLIIAGIADRLSNFTPKSLRNTALLQRAKLYVHNNLSNFDLNPDYLASAMGVSLRYLQHVFQSHNLQISDWIWHQRLAKAAARLADPMHAHLSIGHLAYGCGFQSQAHFSKRFREQFGTSPSEYRHEKFLSEQQVASRNAREH